MVKAVGDCAVIVFYYLLRVGEYTVKKQINETNQTVQFKLEDTITILSGGLRTFSPTANKFSGHRDFVC